MQAAEMHHALQSMADGCYTTLLLTLKYKNGRCNTHQAKQSTDTTPSAPGPMSLINCAMPAQGTHEVQCVCMPHTQALPVHNTNMGFALNYNAAQTEQAGHLHHTNGCRADLFDSQVEHACCSSIGPRCNSETSAAGVRGSSSSTAAGLAAH
jgi:hypothetical protein